MNTIAQHVERIYDGAGRSLAIIVYNDFVHEGIRFFTESSCAQQLGYMNHPTGHEIQPHTHKKTHRIVSATHETLFIRSGKLQVDFYNDAREPVCSRVCGAGDVLLLLHGGHGFKVLETVEMFEVKQGPYVTDGDKERFEPTLPTDFQEGAMECSPSNNSSNALPSGPETPTS